MILCRSLLLLVLTSLTAYVPTAYAVTIYSVKNAAPTTTTSATGGKYSGLAAYNPTTLSIPAPPTPFPTTYNVQVQDGPAPPGSSISQLSSFFGFSIEMSVSDQVCKFHFFLGVNVCSCGHDSGSQLPRYQRAFPQSHVKPCSPRWKGQRSCRGEYPRNSCDGSEHDIWETSAEGL
jgi:hypothetical protein